MTGVIVLASDDRFVTPLGVALASLGRVVHAGTRSVILHQGIGPDAAIWLNSQAGPDLSVELVQVPDELVAGARLPSHLPPATLFRLFADDLLDSSIERFLYLDVDLLIRADPTGLLETPIDGLGAARDTYRPWVGGRPLLPWDDLSIEPGTPYFNAGVLVIDRAWWREGAIGERCLELIRRYRFPYADQDALNLVVAGRWTALPARWNVQTDIFRDQALGWVVGSVDELRAAVADPGIVHFTGSEKPWNTASPTGFAEAWMAELRSIGRADWATVSEPTAFELAVRRARRKLGRIVAGE